MYWCHQHIYSTAYQNVGRAVYKQAADGSEIISVLNKLFLIEIWKLISNVVYVNQSPPLKHLTQIHWNLCQFWTSIPDLYLLLCINYQLFISDLLWNPSLHPFTRAHSYKNPTAHSNVGLRSQCRRSLGDAHRTPTSTIYHYVLQETTVTWSEEEEGGTCRTLAPTLFLKAYDLGVRAKAVPRRAVVDGLEVGRDDVAHGQRGDHSFFGGDGLHGVAAGRSGLQHGFLPWPGLKKKKKKKKTGWRVKTCAKQTC